MWPSLCLSTSPCVSREGLVTGLGSSQLSRIISSHEILTSLITPALSVQSHAQAAGLGTWARVLEVTPRRPGERGASTGQGDPDHALLPGPHPSPVFPQQLLWPPHLNTCHHDLSGQCAQSAGQGPGLPHGHPRDQGSTATPPPGPPHSPLNLPLVCRAASTGSSLISLKGSFVQHNLLQDEDSTIGPPSGGWRQTFNSCDHSTPADSPVH